MIKEVPLPKKGLKAKVLRRFLDPDKMGFEFHQGLKITLPCKRDVYVWVFIPPPGAYTDWELSSIVDETFDWFCQKKQIATPKNLWSTYIADQMLMIVESIAGKPEIDPGKGARKTLAQLAAERGKNPLRTLTGKRSSRRAVKDAARAAKSRRRKMKNK